MVVDRGHFWFLVLPCLFNVCFGTFLLWFAGIVIANEVLRMKRSRARARAGEGARAGVVAGNRARAVEARPGPSWAVKDTPCEMLRLLLSRTHPEDPANALDCAICLDRMDSITMRTTVHPDTGQVHVDVKRVWVAKCSRCKCALHVSCLSKMLVAGGRRCPCCNLGLTNST